MTAPRRPIARPWGRARLLQGASALAVLSLLDGGAASAQTLSALRGAANLAASTGVPAIVAPANPNVAATNAAMNSASARALTNIGAATSAVSIAQQAQVAARAAAAALEPSVPNGLGLGGLNPVANPTLASADATGLSTWQGAGAPTQSISNGQTTVTVSQTSPLAVLDWTSFNVGQNTTLVFNQSQASWVALNRIVGQINPLTGLRSYAGTPTAIEGRIKSKGEVLILDPNGVIFGGTAQINTYSLGVTSLDIGQSLTLGGSTTAPMTIQQRNEQFLTYGLLGFAEQASVNDQPSAYTFSAEAISNTAYDPILEGPVTVQAGAQITSASTGFLLFVAPKVVNSGALTSPDGEVALQSGREVILQASDGTTSSVNSNVRGFVLSAVDRADASGNYVENTASGVIQVPDGYISLASTASGAVINQGVLSSSTSISRNGYIALSGLDIQLAGDSTISIIADDSAGTIPQDTTSLSGFQSSLITIGGVSSRIEMDTGSLIYAPSANVTFGAASGSTTTQQIGTSENSRIFIDSGATIDVAGLTNVIVPASRNSIAIDPVTLNELADSPDYKSSFLNGATVYVDPRLSGVNADGVAWVGSPLIEAASYAQQVGVTASELMTKGGNVTLGVASAQPGATSSSTPTVVIKPNAVIDISGGWVTYQGGMVKTTELIDSSGQVVNIGDANPNDTYVGIFNGYTQTQTKWGVTQTFANPLLTGGEQYEAAYTEGRDAGSLTIKSSAVALDGTVYANAFPGADQILSAQPGTATSTIYGDGRLLQAAPSQLPSGGFLHIQAFGQDSTGTVTGGGGDIDVTASASGSSTSQLSYGQSVSVDASGDLVVPTPPAAQLPTDRLDTIGLSATALSAMGLSDLSLQTSGKITIESGANITLGAGGEFDGLAGRAITIDGSVTTASGRINLTTANLGSGSVFNPDTAALGSFDITVDGALSTRGQWVNDFNTPGGVLQAATFLNGGEISLTAAPSITSLTPTATVGDSLSGAAPTVNTDISGSILVNSGARLDVSGGGYVSPTGALTLTSKGGDLTLTEATAYFQLNVDPNELAGGISGFRVNGLLDASGADLVAVNPSQVNASVFIAPGTILADGFAGGGTFTLTTPQISIVAPGSSALDTRSVGTVLPLDFFNLSGFANYKIYSYKTDLVANSFANGLGGYNAVLQTQTVTVGSGQSLNLTQSGFSPLVTSGQTSALRSLASGGDLYSVLTPATPTDAWDQLPVSLTLGGLTDLDVAAGGQVVGAAGSSLTVSGLLNQGVIRLPGGTLTQSEILPTMYAASNTVAVGSLSQLFSVNTAGQIQENAPNQLGVTGSNGVLTNAQVAGQDGIYLLGVLPANTGVQLAAGSVTDLSGVAIVDPRAKPLGGVAGVNGDFVDGKVVAGGTIQAESGSNTAKALFATPIGASIYASEDPIGVVVGGVFSADDAVVNISGAAATFDRQGVSGAYASTLVSSNAGSLNFGGGAVLQGVSLAAAGGAANAMGGTLTIPNLVLTQVDQAQEGLNMLSANLIQTAGFANLVAEGSLTTQGDVSLTLSHAFFLTTGLYGDLSNQNLNSAAERDHLAPLVSATGDLQISAPYIALDSQFQSVSTPATGTAGNNSVTFSAELIDIVGAVRFDSSLASVNFNAQGDVRLIGVEPWQLNYNLGSSGVSNSLAGQLSVTGDLTITAAQVYPTTGSSFILSSTAANGTISFAQTPGSTPAAPYSAGGSLLVQAANIVQGGTVLAPLGALTLGSNTALSLTDSGTTSQFAPATQSVTLLTGSTTSVSAQGLSIPYGTTTDQTEWYFSPTNSSPLTAPPAGVLTLAGQGVSIATKAKVDLSGGGDVYAYEFIAGTGGSHDVLSQYNTDPFTGNAGYQYADGRQVYAIVPGLSSQVAAAYDPIYSANYASLYSPSAVGMSVYLNGGPGLAAGWYTLLPAQYAMLPGGMRVVQDTSATTVPPSGGQVLNDGTVVVSGQFGVAGTAVKQSTIDTFDVQSQTTFEKYSDIALTSGDKNFATLAAHNGVVTPQLPIDAGQLVLAPVTSLSLQTAIDTTPAAGGRGSQVDVSGADIDIVSQGAAASVPGSIALTATELTDLNADSLLIGGQRTQNSDGTTSIDVTAHSITVENSDKDPLSAPEVLLAVDGAGSDIRFKSGADITATGSADASATGDYVINGATSGMTGQGAFVRIANAPERLVTRENIVTTGPKGKLFVEGDVTLDGTSVLLDSSGDLTMAPSVALTATHLALDADAVSFVQSGGGSGLVITPTLQAKFAAASDLTLGSASPISFAPGAAGTATYAFGDLSLDTPGLAGSGQITLTAKDLTLANSLADGGACSVAGGCGAGQLTISAQQITFGSGALNTYGFGGQVSLTATSGVYADGAASLNVGSAPLAIQTPFIGDQATPATTGSTTSAQASLSLTSLAAVSISNPGGAAAAVVAGTPGASLTINGASISVSGTDLRATAGSLTLNSAAGIAIGAGAVLETPGYSKDFGDAADPYSISAPGGDLTLNAQAGGISVASGATLSVGGGTGAAGALSLSATGTIALNGTISAAAPSGGASFNLNTGGGFDLTGFERQWGSAFTGDLTVHAATGDLSLASGVTITASNVSLTTDTGLVDIAGAINVSGINGGDVGLFGAAGVTLESGSLIDAHANGYGAGDTRQASAGAVTLGVSGTGSITVDNGAVIDLTALRSQSQLIPQSRDGATIYSFVPADIGGSLTLRAPVFTDANGAEDVHVGFAGAVTGASAITVQAYQAYDLGAVAASGDFVGVTQTAPGQITLSTTTAGSAATPNFLADNAPGTLVNFIQTFNLSAANGKLGGLTGLAGFVEQPGVELDYSGSVTLASNWNLGAGTVNVAGAVTAGLMAPVPNMPGKYYVIPGDEAAVFSNYTDLTYRVGGSVTGESGALAIRAGGDLTLNGSVTDGFFTFADQTDPTYLSLALGGGVRDYQGFLTPSCSAVSCAGGSNLVTIAYPSSSGLSATFNNPIPYSALANSPGAEGLLAGGTGDPIGSAILFPLVSLNSGGEAVAQSWSYQFVAGAAASANPMQTTTNTGANLVIQGLHPYQYGATNPVSTFTSVMDLAAGAGLYAPGAWLSAYEAANPALNDSSQTLIDFSGAPRDAQTTLGADAVTWFAANAQPSQYALQGTNLAKPTGVQTTLQLAAEFLQQAPSVTTDFRTPVTDPYTSVKTAYAPTLVRTGTGSIGLAASGTVNLENGSEPVYLNANGAVSTPKNGEQLGGVAVYTAGHAVDTAPSTYELTPGETFVFDTTDSGSSADILTGADNLNYRYGAGTGIAGVLIANPVYATGGGDITVTAGADVLGRRNDWLESQLGDNGGGAALGYSWIGNGDQAWRSGAVGPATDIRIDPQLFQEGLGTLGGGNISITAGGNVSDISVIDTTTVATAKATASIPSESGLALVTYGGGNVAITAGGDLLGGRIDVGSGLANIVVGGDVAAAGSDNLLRLRLTDATIDLQAGGSVQIQGLSALGVIGASSNIEGNLDSLGFYSAKAGVSIVADGAVTVANNSADLLTQAIPANDSASNAVYPGSLQLVSMTGDLDLATPNTAGSASAVVLYPSPLGTLTLAAAGDIAPVTLNMEDADPNLLPGAFTNFRANTAADLSGQGFVFPTVLSDTNETDLAAMHNADPTHLGDPTPNRIYAGGDITDMILSTPKQTRIGAGQDIINMVFFGQNLAASDITRIVAGRDITATTELVQPVLSASDSLGAPLPAVQGNSFVIGGPGSFFLEAGRDAGPFLNSAVTDGFTNDLGAAIPAGQLTYGGGILSVGNQWNPWLAQVGADIYTEFGVAKGQDFAALTQDYLNPANLSSMPDYLFVQTTNAAGISIPDRSQPPIYAPILIAWMQANAPAALASATAASPTASAFQQAYNAFLQLPPLQQQIFLLNKVYFNELAAASIKTSGSYLNYSRGYLAVNALFPSSLGYTDNNLSGGSNGANTLVSTGNLDLRLATIQTDQGGDIFILGPGGRVLAGSTVATATQAAQRAYEGGLLFSGDNASGLGTPLASAITSIPTGDEGILTLKGGAISTFTDQDFLLNQSRVFTEAGGQIVMWSSNGDLNAGQGPKTSADVPPVVVDVNQDAYSQVNQDAAVSGAGIGSFNTDPNAPPSDVFLIAPRGTVDAGAAGIRVAGNLFIAANAVANASNIQVTGTSSGVPVASGLSVGLQSNAGASAAAAAQTAQAVSNGSGPNAPRSQISVSIVGDAGDLCPPDDKTCKR